MRVHNQRDGWQQERRTQDYPRKSILIYQRVAQLCEERVFANKQVGPEARWTHKQSRYTNAGGQVKLVQRDPPGGQQVIAYIAAIASPKGRTRNVSSIPLFHQFNPSLHCS